MKPALFNAKITFILKQRNQHYKDPLDKDLLESPLDAVADTLPFKVETTGTPTESGYLGLVGGSLASPLS